MNEHETRWQEDCKKAFEWVNDVYEQTATAREDAQAAFQEDGWMIKYRDGWGGDATTTSLTDWPFLYLTAFCALPPEVQSGAKSGVAAIFGFFFFDDKRVGPQCFAGKVRWSDALPQPDHWLLYHALNGPGDLSKHFERTGNNIRTAVPKDKAKAWKPSVDELRWFEVPLGTISSAEKLRDIVAATEALVRGDEGPARKLVESI